VDGVVKEKRPTYSHYLRDEFAKDVAKHEMRVVRDDGLHRHLRFRAPTSGFCWFEVVTWPGVLVINGDCGSYTFARIEDMFAFFRRPDGAINPSYWSEKLLATDRDDAHYEYSEQKARDAVAAEMRELRQRGASNDVVRDFRESVALDSSADELKASVDAWSLDVVGEEWRVDGFWERELDDYTRRFLWNCHAIVWAIAQYDAAKALHEIQGVA